MVFVSCCSVLAAQLWATPDVKREMETCFILILLGMNNLCRCWKWDLWTTICSQVTFSTYDPRYCLLCQLFVIIVIFTSTLPYCLVVKSLAAAACLYRIPSPHWCFFHCHFWCFVLFLRPVTVRRFILTDDVFRWRHTHTTGRARFSWWSSLDAK